VYSTTPAIVFLLVQTTCNLSGVKKEESRGGGGYWAVASQSVHGEYGMTFLHTSPGSAPIPGGTRGMSYVASPRLLPFFSSHPM